MHMLLGLITYASSFSEYYSGFSSVIISRMTTNESKLVEVQEVDLKNFILQPRDSIQVPSYKNEIQPVRKVLISGMVNRSIYHTAN